MLQQILRVANTQLAQVVVDSHPRLLTKLLAQRALAAPFPLAKTVKKEGTIEAARQLGEQLIEQRFALSCRQIIGGVAIALKNKHQLRKQQFGHIIGLRIAAAAFMLQLGNHLSDLGHAAAANPPVRNPRGAEQARNVRRPVKVKPQPIRAINDVLQDEIVYRGVGVLIFRADIEQIAAGNAPRAIVKNVQAVSPPHQHQFAELMGVLGEDILRIAIRYRHRLSGGGKKFIFAKNQLTCHDINSEHK